MCSFCHFCLFCFFCKLKLLSKNLTALIILVLVATFAPNLTFLGLLTHEIFIGKNTHSHTQTPRHSAYFAVTACMPVVLCTCCFMLRRDVNFWVIARTDRRIRINLLHCCISQCLCFHANSSATAVHQTDAAVHHHSICLNFFSQSPTLNQGKDLRSSSRLQLVVQCTRRSTIGDRAFAVAASRAWNSPPDLLHKLSSLINFKRH